MFLDALRPLPLVAILRGIAPKEAEGVVSALFEAGFRAVEVPLNSPEPFESIGLIARRFGDRMAVGAGTVLAASEVGRVAESGGTFIVAPNLNLDVVARAKELGLGAAPGVFSPTEAFAALDARADILKLFPAELLPPAAVKALRAVLPGSAMLMPVGGITPEAIAPYRLAGADGFGIGSALYKPGLPPKQVCDAARRFVEAMRSSEPR